MPFRLELIELPRGFLRIILTGGMIDELGEVEVGDFDIDTCAKLI